MGPNTGSNIFGGITFVLIIALALAAIAVIIYGRQLKVRRLNAEKDLIERREAAHVEAVVIEPEAPVATVEAVAVDPVDAAPAPKAKAAQKPKATPASKAAPKAAPAEPKPTAPAPKTPPAEPKAKAAAPKPKAAPAAPNAEVAPATPEPERVAAAPAVTAATAPSSEGDITQLKGLGPKLAATLAELGYTRLDQIAALTPAQATELDAKLGAFQGRMARDRWIEQATLLVAGDREAYEAAFGKLG